jgi:nitroreductase
MMLQAADIGLGSTWVMHFDAAKIRAAIELPETIIPAALLPMGCPADNAAPADRHGDRKPRNKIIFFERL